MKDDELYKFMSANKRFKNAGHDRHFILLNKVGDAIGFIWFKNILGGWRLKLGTDKSNEWEARGVIENSNKMKSFLEE